MKLLLESRARERAFLATAIRQDVANPARLRELSGGGLDWSFLIERARRSAVLPTLGHALGRLGLLGIAPAQARAELDECARQTAVHNTLLLRDLATAVEALERAGIPSVVLKGGALLAAGHCAPGARHTDDLDLLVREEDHPGAARVLDGLGYRALRQPVRPDGGVAADHHTAHVSPLGSMLELHRAVPGAGDLLGDLEVLRARGERVELHGVAVAVPCPDDLLGGLCVHVVRYHRMQLRYLARHVADVSLLLSGGRVDEAALEAHQAAPRARMPLQVSGALVRSVGVGPGLPASERAASRLLFPSRATANFSLLLGAALETVRDEGLRGTWFNLFPSRRHMAAEWGAPESFPGVLAHYPRRLLQLLGNLVPLR